MATKNSRRHKQEVKTSSEVAIIESILAGLGSLIMFIWKSIRGGDAVPAASKQARQQLRDGWEQVEMLVLQPNSAPMAVSEGDKLLDAGLKLIGAKGESMGERLKSSEKRFTAELYHRVWEAHKLRNRLAHEVGAQAHASEAKTAVASFREALNSIGLI